MALDKGLPSAVKNLGQTRHISSRRFGTSLVSSGQLWLSTRKLQFRYSSARRTPSARSWKASNSIGLGSVLEAEFPVVPTRSALAVASSSEPVEPLGEIEVDRTISASIAPLSLSAELEQSFGRFESVAQRSLRFFAANPLGHFCTPAGRRRRSGRAVGCEILAGPSYRMLRNSSARPRPGQPAHSISSLC